MTLADRACLVTVVAIAAAVLLPRAASAQSAEAEVLFQDGRALLKDGKIALACDKLDASARLDPSVGALLNVGDCREKLGQVASAWAAFRKAEALAKRLGHDDKRQAEASRRAFKLEAQLTYVTIDVSHPVVGLIIRRNGLLVEPGMWNSPLPIDPGSYAIVAEAPGYTPWRTTFQITSRIRGQFVVIPELEFEPVAVTREPPITVQTVAPPQPAPTIPALPVRSERVMAPDPDMTTTRKLSLALGVVGVAALGTGVYFGVHGRSLQEQADQRCPLTVCADPLALRQNENARASEKDANVLYVAGGAVVATAVVMWFVGKPGEQSTVIRPTFNDRHVGVSLAGSF